MSCRMFAWVSVPNVAEQVVMSVSNRLGEVMAMTKELLLDRSIQDSKQVSCTWLGKRELQLT